MIRNVYYMATCCGNHIVKYIDDKYKDKIKKQLQCNCGKNKWEESEVIKQGFQDSSSKTGILGDHRSYDKDKYMSQDYKRKKSQINDFHVSKTGRLSKLEG